MGVHVGTAALTECGGVWYEDMNGCQHQIRRLLTSQPTLLRKEGQGLGLYVEGTIPITHRGNRYYIPVRIVLPYNFPEVPPIIHVVPAGNMVVARNHPNVSMNGKVKNLPYLWISNLCELVELVEKLQNAFSVNCPLFKTNRWGRQPQRPVRWGRQPQHVRRPAASPPVRRAVARQPVRQHVARPPVQPPVARPPVRRPQPSPLVEDEDEKVWLCEKETCKFQSKLSYYECQGGCGQWRCNRCCKQHTADDKATCECMFWECDIGDCDFKNNHLDPQTFEIARRCTRCDQPRPTLWKCACGTLNLHNENKCVKVTCQKDDPSICAVCTNHLDQDTITVDERWQHCLHAFHVICAQRIRGGDPNAPCPVCRKPYRSQR